MGAGGPETLSGAARDVLVAPEPGRGWTEAGFVAMLGTG
jgi:hypothetical protein